MADHHEKMDHSEHMLSMALADARRADDMARDQYRHPKETLEFFGLKPDMTVVEYAPGGGWYTRVLLPYIQANGKYIGVNGSSPRKADTKTWSELFPAKATEWTGVPADSVAAFESDAVPEDMLGKVDRVVIFRSLHGLLNGERADSELRSLRKMLKDDGMIGVVQHRANEDATYERSNGSKGYLKQSDVIALFALNGFELVDSSEINANPKDTKDYEIGVWTLPPVLATAKNNPGAQDSYKAIGESDRMTLLFKKLP